MKISFFVPGTPQPGGSKKAFVIPGTNRASIVDDAKHGGTWRDRVAYYAQIARVGGPLDGPLEVSMQFVEARPKGHYGTGRNAGRVRDSAPRYPMKKPDVLKLARSTEDSCTGILWRDDCLTVDLTLSKRYGERPGVHISVWTKEGAR